MQVEAENLERNEKQQTAKHNMITAAVKRRYRLLSYATTRYVHSTKRSWCASDVIEVHPTEKRRFPPPLGVSETAHVSSPHQYEQLWKQSVQDPAGFWGPIASQFEWYQKVMHFVAGCFN